MVLPTDKGRIFWAVVPGTMTAKYLGVQRKLYYNLRNNFGDFPRLTGDHWDIDAKLKLLGISHQGYFLFLFQASKKIKKNK